MGPTATARGPTGREASIATPPQLRRSAAIRVGASVLIAGAATTLAIVLFWGPLSVKTDVIGYPIFADFNPYNYFRAFYFAIGVFPVLSVLLFLGLTRIGPRVGLPVPPPRGSLRLNARAPSSQPLFDGDPPLISVPPSKGLAVVVARIAFVGAVLGLEAGIAADHVWRGVMLGTLTYGLATVAGAWVLGRAGPGDRPLIARLSPINTVGTVLTVVGLFVVSANTEVHVLADGSTDRYPWFPLWLALPVAAALGACITAGLRRHDAMRVERWALLLVVAPVSLFVLLATLPGALPGFDSFERGQLLVGARLVEDGFLPWRDVVLAHGVLQDAVSSSIGFAVFGNTAWSNTAVYGIYLGPLYLVASFFLFSYLFGRNWIFLLLSSLVLLYPELASADFRIILWPAILLLLARVLEHPTRLTSIALAFLVVGQAIITPEAAPAIVAITAVLFLYELYGRERGTPLISAFPRLLWFAGAGIAFAAVFAVYMAIRGGLDDFIYISATLPRGHVLVGALPPGPNPNTISQALFDFLALTPPAVLLIAFAYAAARLRLRRGFSTQDWVMAAVAIFLALYYAKFLSRMDNHAYQPYGVALPLLLFIIYRVVGAAERTIRDRWPRNAVLGLTAHPVSLVLVVVFAALTWGTLRDRVADAPARYDTGAANAPEVGRLGYAQSFDAVAYRDLKRVVDAYLGPTDTLFDFTGSPGLFFYLMDRDPSTRFPLAMGVADNTELQEDILDQLREVRPKLVVFDTTDFAYLPLANFDGTPSMVRLYLVSRWILDHYRPLISTHGYTFYARRDAPAASPTRPKLAVRPTLRNLEFLTQQCTWGFSPNFLSGAAVPAPGAQSVNARAGTVSNPQATIAGWAGDPEANAPAREVLATVDGRIVGRAVPQIDRPDLITGGWPSGFARAGFHVQIPAALQGSDKVHVYGVADDGSVAELPLGTSASPRRGTVRLNRRLVRLDPEAVNGYVDLTLGPPSLQIELPRDSRWTDYRWLEIDPGKGGFRKGNFALFDDPGRPSVGREITFQTLDGSPDRYVIPVGSCAQWHGYRSRRLFLAADPSQEISAVRLIR